MIIGDCEIKATPEVLHNKAAAVTGKLRQMQESLDILERVMAGTKDYWIGEAGELHRKMYEDEKEKVREIMKRLNEHPVDLQLIAQQYTSTEKVIEEIIAGLPGDVIS